MEANKLEKELNLTLEFNSLNTFYKNTTGDDFLKWFYWTFEDFKESDKIKLIEIARNFKANWLKIQEDYEKEKEALKIETDNISLL